MKKNIFLLALCLGASLAVNSQEVHWTLGPLNVPEDRDPNIGTSSNDPLNLVTNNNVVATFGTDGGFKINAFSGTRNRLIYADANGNFRTTGGAGGGVLSSTACVSGNMPWYQGGNLLAVGSSNEVGTCSNDDFLLKANNVPLVFLTTSNKVGIGPGNTNPNGQLDVSDGNNSGVNHTRIYGSSSGIIESTGDMNLLFNSSGAFHISTGTFASNTPQISLVGGNVGIGTGNSSLSSKLTLNVTGSSSNAALALNIFDTYSSAANFRVYSNGKTNVGSQNSAVNAAQLNINVAGASGNPVNAFDVFDQYSGTINFRITSSGKTNIGYQGSSTNAAQLNVNVASTSGGAVNALDIFDQYNGKVAFRIKSNGFAYAREINVMPTTITFPDYVFAKNYKLKTIENLESYIEANKHLPNIPSAKEVERDGINLAEMQIKQMEKLEEAFLYIIQLKKENDALRNRIDIIENTK